MPYAILYNHLAAIPVGILVVYITLFIVQQLRKYAMLLQPEGSQQADLAISENTPSTETITKGSESLHELFQSDTGSPGTSVSGGDSATIKLTRATQHDKEYITRTANNSATEDQNSKGHLCEKLSKDCNGPATGPPNRGHISLPGGDHECDGLHESSTSSENPQREEAEIPELVDIPLPEDVEQDKVPIEDSDWSPPIVAYRQVNCKRRYSTQFPDIEKEACTRCGLIKCKSWPGRDEQ